MIVLVARNIFEYIMGGIMAVIQKRKKDKQGLKEKTTRVRAVKTCKNKYGDIIAEGAIVRLSRFALVAYAGVSEEFAGRPITKAKVSRISPDVRGLVFLERKLGGYWTWNVDDLEEV